MKTWMFSATLCLSLAAPIAAADPEAAKNTPAIQKYYDEALNYYAAGDYRMAVMKWMEILKEDAEQRSAQTMILDARQKIQLLTRKRRQTTFAHIAAGRYRKALLELQALLDQDPGDPQLEALQTRLEAVIRITPQLAPDDKTSRIAILGLKGFLGLPTDHTLAHDALRYARELGAGDPRYEKFLALLLADVPSLANQDVMTPGMKFMEYKHFVALHQIYDAKYHLAVATLAEILVLEPDDLLALKRLGSAFYSLGRMEEARKAWSAALVLSPNDKTLRLFMEKARKYKSSAAKR
ncbi:MAG: hypothetical protein A2506_03710 [Elusimicrobia bacterium RIFOXYD12_FULL_66_9]|nr:MAG: hypothetical protein A2506_03710 [Elusimicrobia bacterium RIFOXYD12_FULL_66_9]